MVVTQNFDYHKPTSIEEVLQLIQNDKSYILSGGTDLALFIKENKISVSSIVDIKGITELNSIKFENNKLYIGAGVTFSEIIKSEIINKYFPLLAESAKTVASVGVRNRATLVGNICSAVPSLDSGPALLVYDAKVIIKNTEKEKEVSIHDFFIKPRKTIVNKGEIVTAVVIDFPSYKTAGCYVKLGRYKGEDLAQAGIAILAFENNTFKIAHCAVAPVSKRFTEIENILNSNEITLEIIEQCKEIIEKTISPITDIRATKEYRLHMMKVMFERGLNLAVSRLHGESDYSQHNILG